MKVEKAKAHNRRGDDIFQAIMSLNASWDLELDLQGVRYKSETQYLQ